jgi:hypothetical protein
LVLSGFSASLRLEVALFTAQEGENETETQLIASKSDVLNMSGNCSCCVIAARRTADNLQKSGEWLLGALFTNQEAEIICLDERFNSEWISWGQNSLAALTHASFCA